MLYSTFVIIIVTINFSSCIVNSAEIIAGSSLARTFNFSESQLIKNHPWHDNTKLLYARCNSSQTDSGKKCIISVIIDAFESSNTSAVCEVTLKPETPKGIVSDSLLVFKFGSDKVIVVWMETINSRNATTSSTLKTSVVHMLNRCQTFTSMIHTYSAVGQSFTVDTAYQTYFNIIASKDSYEMILKDVMNDCKFRSNCTRGYGIFKFDAQAQKISGPDQWPTPTYNDKLDVNIVVAVEPGNSDSGYFIFNRNQSRSISYITMKENDDYKKLVLKETPNEKSTWYSGISLANQAIGICYHFASNSSTVCWQFNQKGQAQRYARVNFKRQRQRPLAAVYNVNNNDGLLMLVVDCSQSDNCDENYLVKIGREATIDVVNFQFNSTKCSQQQSMTFRAFQNKKSQYCVARLCESIARNSMRLDTATRCFTNNDFSKCNDCL